MSGPPPAIDGATRLFAIIGDPVAQVRSPQVFNPILAAAGLNAVLVPCHVLPDRFEASVRGLMALGNLDGIVVTVPYKVRALAVADRVLPVGRQVGAVNALRREPDGTWSADMFDGRGLTRGLREQAIPVEGARAMVIGSGGAGSAVAVALAEAGAAALTLFDVDGTKAEALAARVREAYPSCAVRVGAPEVQGHDMLVNATPIGMAPGDGLPADLGTLPPGLLVVDVVMKPEVTPLMRHARACGCRVIGGRTMLEGQAEELADFLGMRVPGSGRGGAP
ncbi:MAG TPA: shikimate dehydrogenase [Microvirga sp.]|jgi:shikimate dehydrogenase|nr:shikimate dehydrogenase [Microvirga sp.]